VDELTWDGLITHQSRADRAILGSLRERDLSGFEIWRWLGSEPGTIGLLNEADLYPTLYRLEAEHLLQSDWREGERTRRTYRLTATALARGEANDWPEIPFRGKAASRTTASHPGAVSSHSKPIRSSRIASPDPEAGSWFIPPNAAALEAAETSEPTGWSSTGSRTSDPGRDASSTSGRPRRRSPSAQSGAASDYPAVARYADGLGAALDLPRIDNDSVRQEIADHLTDSTRLLVQDGMDARAAAALSIDHFGEVRKLAARIGGAQQSEERRSRAVRRAVFELVGEMMLWLAASAAALVLGPGLAGIVTSVGGFFGLHLVVLESAEWATNQMAAMMCVGAFAAGRMSMGHLARISRHSDASVRKPWAIGGATAVLALALLMPGFPDALVVVTVFTVPLAFVAGTYRTQHQNEGAYTWRGLATAALLVAVVTLLPAGRLFAYDPARTPGAPLAQGAASTNLTIYPYGDGTFGYEMAGATSLVRVELWPAKKEGPFIVVDRSARQPTLSNVAVVDLTKLPPGAQWWVASIVVGPDGQLTTRAVVVQTGASPSLSNALAWLVSQL
jgi:Transcriptional regulator PadR-like family